MEFAAAHAHRGRQFVARGALKSGIGPQGSPVNIEPFLEQEFP